MSRACATTRGPGGRGRVRRPSAGGRQWERVADFDCRCWQFAARVADFSRRAHSGSGCPGCSHTTLCTSEVLRPGPARYGAATALSSPSGSTRHPTWAVTMPFPCRVSVSVCSPRSTLGSLQIRYLVGSESVLPVVTSAPPPDRGGRFLLLRRHPESSIPSGCWHSFSAASATSKSMRAPPPWPIRQLQPSISSRAATCA